MEQEAWTLQRTCQHHGMRKEITLQPVCAGNKLDSTRAMRCPATSYKIVGLTWLCLGLLKIKMLISLQNKVLIFTTSPGLCAFAHFNFRLASLVFSTEGITVFACAASTVHKSIGYPPPCSENQGRSDQMAHAPALCVRLH